SLGDAALLDDDCAQAAVWVQQALALSVQIEDKFTILSCLGRLAGIARREGNAEQQQRLLREAWTMWQEISAPDLIPGSLQAIAEVALRTGQEERGVRLYAAVT